MNTTRQKALVAALIEIWLPLLLAGEISEAEFKAEINFAFEAA